MNARDGDVNVGPKPRDTRNVQMGTWIYAYAERSRRLPSPSMPVVNFTVLRAAGAFHTVPQILRW